VSGVVLNHRSPEKRARRAKVIRNAVILALLAVAIYATFIMLAAERGPGAL
jgi:hypothetical protein